MLVFKLAQIGINGRIFNFINSFLSRRTFQVRLGSSLSTTKTLENGIPQSSVLSLILFTIAINDLPESISTPSALYAEDCYFWESCSNIEQLYHHCHTSLNKIAAWCTKWGFRASSSKFAVVLFTKKRTTFAHKLTLCSSDILLKKEYKYLGNILQRNGAYTFHLDYVHSNCLKRLNLLRMLKSTSWGASKRPLPSLYRTFIQPVTEYGMEAYFFSALSWVDPIPKIQNEALRICTGAMKNTHRLSLFNMHAKKCLYTSGTNTYP